MFKKLFKKKQKELIKVEGVFSTLIYQNNHLKLNYKAYKLAKGLYFDSQYKDNDFKTQVDYIKNEYNGSIDHSNIITFYEVDKDVPLESIFEVIRANEKNDFKLKMYFKENKDGEYIIVMGGTITDYKKLIINNYNQENKIIKKVINELYNTNSCYFTDFIEQGIMEEKLFINYDNIDKTFIETRILDNIMLYNLDPIDDIKKQLKNYIPDVDDDLVRELSNTTIYIFDISLIATMELLKSNFNITYEDYTKSKYDSLAFNSDEIDIKDILINNYPYSGTGLNLGNRITEVYNQLKDTNINNNDLIKYLLLGNQTNLILTLNVNQIYNCIEFIKTLDYKEKILNNIMIGLSRVLETLGLKTVKIDSYKKYEDDLVDNSITTEALDKVRIEYEKIPDLSELIQEDEDGTMHYDPNDFI